MSTTKLNHDMFTYKQKGTAKHTKGLKAIRSGKIQLGKWLNTNRGLGMDLKHLKQLENLLVTPISGTRVVGIA